MKSSAIFLMLPFLILISNCRHEKDVRQNDRLNRNAESFAIGDTKNQRYFYLADENGICVKPGKPGYKTGPCERSLDRHFSIKYLCESNAGCDTFELRTKHDPSWILAIQVSSTGENYKMGWYEDALITNDLTNNNSEYYEENRKNIPSFVASRFKFMAPRDVDYRNNISKIQIQTSDDHNTNFKILLPQLDIMSFKFMSEFPRPGNGGLDAASDTPTPSLCSQIKNKKECKISLERCKWTKNEENEGICIKR